MRSFLFFWFSIFFTGWLVAAEEPAVKPLVKPLVGGDSVSTASPWVVIFGLLFVVAVIFAAAWALRRYGATGLTGGQHMKVLSVLPVGPREKVVLVDVAGKQMLLGVTPNNVNQLHYFDRPIVDSEAIKSSEFANKMKQFLNTDK
jgi:flagellar protein FliO/FliZ